VTYRAVVKHIRYWRGAPHIWSTVYQFAGTLSKPLDVAAATTVLQWDDNMCAKSLASEGGTFECSIYDQATGGVPLVSYTKFDHTVTADWTGYGASSYWANTAAVLAQPAEAALGVKWIAGLSKSGKPVYLRKWWHAVPLSAPGGPANQIGTTVVASLQTGAAFLPGLLSAYGLVAASASGRLAGVATVSGQYENHQMPRGRRRKALVKANGTYTGPTIVIPD
jgi:hypothetical protein